MSKTLVAYFSASGVTARLANTLATAVGGDLYEIEPAKPYTSADLNWNNNKSRSSVEMNDPASRPAIAAPVADMEQYDTIFVGFPIWWYEAPRIVQTFLESYDLSGKTIVPFCTSGGSGLGKTPAILQKSCPAARMVSGKRLSGSASASELSAWVKSLGL
ncbi:MAG: flavodoxin [Acutalibacteraceae bacterium]|uniref:flavodoxin n=1 Tax=Faecalispora jeddahensis TaxID=1414721 RepID=UPI0027B9D555|nr:flavodoxin [Faecalispora jeddahensis]